MADSWLAAPRRAGDVLVIAGVLYYRLTGRSRKRRFAQPDAPDLRRFSPFDLDAALSRDDLEGAGYFVALELFRTIGRAFA